MNRAVLGLDTSNYRTSLAMVSENGEILLNCRELLDVPQGERGLRQNEAVFAHLRHLNSMADALREKAKGVSVIAVAASTSPRDGNKSYMPVFMVGASYGRLVSAALGVPFIGTTHQRGHLYAAKKGTELEQQDEFLAVHLSGGTTDLLEVRKDDVKQIGGSLDLHAGQLVDRAGVAMGLCFPAGPELERMAVQGKSKGRLGCSMSKGDLFCHFSGAEAQVCRWIQDGNYAGKEIAAEIYDLLARTVTRMIMAGAAKTGLRCVLITGGVASSAMLREMICARTATFRNVPKIVFGTPELSGDNAVGIALIGLKTVQEKQ